MTPKPKKTMTLRDMEVMRTPFRNFEGRPTKFNPEGGKRFFNVRLTEEQAKEMSKEGWKVNELPPRDPQDEPMWIFEIKINLRGPRPPRIVKVSPVGKEPLTEDVLSTLDWADIEYADISFNPYDHGNSDTVSAYLQTAFIHIRMDELELEYALADQGDEDGVDEVMCDDDGVCFVNGVRIN